ncbi:RNA polymerase sigma factor [Fundidesulfovibrio putealis]|uniref:RNA polymerase sigma factor n=1 Tax=Fundidesulfovibrio putealis TaxID=270496 RepID=UPI000684E670|nr:sigma-70 family RNA polymerase sigma factor [Fundidesulfovibrio putealis]
MHRNKDVTSNDAEHQERDAIRAVLSGNANAYRVIVDRHQRPIYNLMLRMSGSEAEALDLSQEAFIKAYQNINKFNGSARFFPWLYSISMNVARDYLRRKKTAPVSYEEDPEEEVGDYAEESEKMCQRLDAARLSAAVLKLPEDYREAVMLRYHHELSLQEVADALGLTLSGAKMRVSRGLGRLRLMLREQNHAIR